MRRRITAPPPAVVTTKATKIQNMGGGWRKGFCNHRLCAAARCWFSCSCCCLHYGEYRTDSSFLHPVLPVPCSVMVALIIAADGASSAIVYLAHNGNMNANWLTICRQYNDFCQALSGALVASLVAALFFVFLVMNSTFALKRK